MTTTLGKYELIEQLGKGGFGTVYRAKDLSLEREVALKILHPQLMVDESFITKFRQEARTLAKLDHINIVPIHELGETDGRVFIAMKHLPGGSLADLLAKRGVLGWERTLKIMSEVCAGLQAGHKQGLVHRDMKPSNILFDMDGRAVLSDFGLARAVQAAGVSTSSSGMGVVGTPAYRAPELWLGKPPVAPATDVYSLACVLVEMLSGKAAFGGETTDQIITKHLVTGPDLPPAWGVDVPESFGEFLKRCFSKDLSDRPQDAGQFDGELGTLERMQETAHEPVMPSAVETTVQAEEIPVPPVPGPTATAWQAPIYPTRPPSERKKAWLPWLAVGGPLLVTGIVLVVVLGTREKPTYTQATQANSNTNAEQVEAGSTNGMVYIPGGTFQMGSNDGEGDEEPVHSVTLSPYWIDSTEVTNAMYVEFLNQMGNQSEGGVTWLDATDSDVRIISQNGEWTPKSGYSNHPVTEVSWYGAKAYCAWAGKRLPTEAEWEFAARGTDGRTYPWGNTTPTCELTNYWPSGSSTGCIGDTAPVGSYDSGKSPYGVYDMAGNVWEWVSDWYGDYSSSSQSNPTGPVNGTYSVLRGGTWYGYEGYIRTSFRYRSVPDYSDFSFGFRCSLTP